MSRLSLLALILATAFVAGPAQSHGTLGSATAHIYLVKDCEAAGWVLADEGVKCFESVSTLNDKIWTGSLPILPTASNPLTVDIGPGEFLGKINCPSGQGHVTYRGAGRDHTIIKHESPSSSSTASALRASSCNALSFQDLKLVAINTSGTASRAVFWTGGGSSSWSDVDIEGENVGWWDSTCGGAGTDPPWGTHYFWGSTIRGGRIGYYAECSNSWFYGGEIAAKTSLFGGTPTAIAGVWVAHRGEFHAFGSAIRALTAGLASGSGTAYGVRVGPKSTGSIALPDGFGEFHSHGGVVSINTSETEGFAAIGLSLEDNGNTGIGAKAHTLETAFALEVYDSPTATATRLSGTGSFESPHLWQALIDPPLAGGEIDGQEVYVETTCDADDCTGGSDPHVMIYSAACTPTPWFDLVRRACRVD